MATTRFVQASGTLALVVAAFAGADAVTTAPVAHSAATAVMQTKPALTSMSSGSATLRAAATYHVTDNLAKRYSPTAAPGPSGGPRRGEAISVDCQVEGEPAGPNANRLYFRTVYKSETIFVPDAWTDSPHLASQPPIAGIPLCGGGNLGTGSNSTPIWWGAPFTGKHADPPGTSGSRPEKHAPTYRQPSVSYKADYAEDFYAVAGTTARLYAAPKDNRLNNVITAQVVDVRNACNDSRNSAGYVVQIAIADRGVRVGVLNYAHLMPDFDRNGVTSAADLNYRGAIDRWGGYLGKVGSFGYSSCYQVRTTQGQHSHLEAMNANPRTFACFRGGVASGASLSQGSYMGYLGGNFVSGRSRACPNGI